MIRIGVAALAIFCGAFAAYEFMRYEAVARSLASETASMAEAIGGQVAMEDPDNGFYLGHGPTIDWLRAAGEEFLQKTGGPSARVAIAQVSAERTHRHELRITFKTQVAFDDGLLRVARLPPIISEASATSQFFLRCLPPDATMTNVPDATAGARIDTVPQFVAIGSPDASDDADCQTERWSGRPIDGEFNFSRSPGGVPAFSPPSSGVPLQEH